MADFDHLISDIEAEAEAAGPDAAELLRDLDAHFVRAAEQITVRRAGAERSRDASPRAHHPFLSAPLASS